MSKNEKTISTLKRNTIKVIIVFCSLALFLLVLEVIYRFQFFDFYKPEITLLNKTTKDKKVRKKILVFGDSFTATPSGYVAKLNSFFPDMQFINSAMPGIGAQEINIIAPSRIDKFNPDMVIVQLYVGNDLIDIKKPINWSNLSVTRNCFWYISNYFYSIRFINYRLAQLKTILGQSIESNQLKNNDSFSVERFSKREQLLLSADPYYYEKSIFVTNHFDDRFESYLKNITDIYTLCDTRNIKLKLLIIPTCCQVNDRYLTHFKTIGAKFNHTSINDTLYPFINKLNARMGNCKSLEILNPLPAFQKAESKKLNLFYNNDIHLNETGDSVLAEFISSTLKW